MSQSLECPRCHLPAESRAGLGLKLQRCDACGTALVLVPTPREADVRRYLYRHRLSPLSRPLGEGKVRTP